MVHPSVIINCLRFFAMCYSLTALHNIQSFTLISSVSTVLYSLLIPLLPSSYFGIIFHKSISHVPSTILLIVSLSSDATYRPHLLALSSIQYLGIWIEMYSNVITLQLKQEISKKQGPRFGSEFLWALNDTFIIMHLYKLSGLNLGQDFDLVYQALFCGFLLRNSLNLLNLLWNVLKIVDFEVKKVKNS